MVSKIYNLDLHRSTFDNIVFTPKLGKVFKDEIEINLSK